MKLFYLLSFSLCLWAEPITLPEAEQRFLANNLELLAKHFEIEASKFLVLQEKLWNNPNFSIQEAINPIWDKDASFNHELQLTQLFVIAKRSKRINIAKLEAKITEWNYKDAVEDFKFELRRSFLTLYYLNQSKGFYQKSIDSIQKTVGRAERVLKERLLLLSDVIRLKALLLSLQKEHLTLLNQITEEQATLAIFLGLDPAQATLEPIFDSQKLFSVKINLRIEEAIQIAFSHRYDLKSSQGAVSQEQLNLSLQRSLWIPDLNLSVNYQQAGNYVPHYIGIQLAFDLPILNWNLGSSRNSFNLLNAKKKREELLQMQIHQQVHSAFQKVLQSQTLLSGIDPSYLSSYDKLAFDVIQSYQKGDMGIIAFADFYESYRDSITNMNETLAQCAIAFEEFNHAVGNDEIQL